MLLYSTQKVSEETLSKLPTTPISTWMVDKCIVSSPYLDHLLNLGTLDECSKELAIVLQGLQANEAYLDLPYQQAFNWSTILSKLSSNFPPTEFHIVVFRSRLNPSVTCEIIDELYVQDELSHLEATVSGGLLKYWFGIPAADRRNLATCVWTSKMCAMKASSLPQHAKAINIVRRGVYESWAVEQYVLHIAGQNQWEIKKADKMMCKHEA